MGKSNFLLFYHLKFLETIQVIHTQQKTALSKAEGLFLFLKSMGVDVVSRFRSEDTVSLGEIRFEDFVWVGVLEINKGFLGGGAEKSGFVAGRAGAG